MVHVGFEFRMCTDGTNPASRPQSPLDFLYFGKADDGEEIGLKSLTSPGYFVMSSLVRCPGSKSLDVGAPTCPVFVNGKIKGSGGWWYDLKWQWMIWYDMIWYDMIVDCFFLFLFSFYHMICSGSGSQAYFPCPANMLLIEVGGWLLELDRGLFTCENDCIRLSITSQKHSKTTWLA